MPIYAHFFRQAILTRKLDQTDLHFSLPCERKSLYAAVICATLTKPKFWPLWRGKVGHRVGERLQLVHTRYVHLRSKFGDRRSELAEIMHIIGFFPMT